MRPCLVLLTSSDAYSSETVPESENYVNSNYRICSFQDWREAHWHGDDKKPKTPHHTTHELILMWKNENVVMTIPNCIISSAFANGV